VLVPIFHGIFWKSRIGPWIWLGAAAALAGLYLLTVPASGLGQLNRGDLIASGCTVMFALHILFVGHFSPKYSPGGLAFYQIAMTAVLAVAAVPFAAAFHWQVPRFNNSPNLWLAIFVTAAFATAFAFSVQVWAQQHTTPTHTAILFSLEPVFAALTSLIVLGERLTGRVLVGAAMIMAGIVAAEVLGGKPVAPDAVE